MQMQNAKVRIADAPRGHGREGTKRSPVCLGANCKTERRVHRTLTLLTFVLCVLTSAFAFCLLPAALNAQGCAMCYTSASTARASAKEALANGVLILLVPPMVFFALIAVVVYRYRNKFRDRATWRPEHDREWQEFVADLAPANAIQGLESSEASRQGALETDRVI